MQKLYLISLIIKFRSYKTYILKFRVVSINNNELMIDLIIFVV